jgi:hypothetical protein
MLNYCDDGGHAFEINNCRHYDLNVDMLIHVHMNFYKVFDE